MQVEFGATRQAAPSGSPLDRAIYSLCKTELQPLSIIKGSVSLCRLYTSYIQTIFFFIYTHTFHFLSVDELLMVNNTERHTQLIEQEVGKFEKVLYGLV